MLATALLSQMGLVTGVVRSASPGGRNLQPTVYKTVALPLSHTSLLVAEVGFVGFSLPAGYTVREGL